LAVITEVKAELKLCNHAKYESVMIYLTLKLFCNNRRTILGGQETGQWLSVLPLTVSSNSTENSLPLSSVTLYFSGLLGAHRMISQHHIVMVDSKSLAVEDMHLSAKQAVS
jgi:hypothetical protein